MILKPLMVGKAAVAAFHDKVKAFLRAEISIVHAGASHIRGKCCNPDPGVGVKCYKSN